MAGIQPVKYNQFQNSEVWSKATDYLYELSVYERIMAEALFVSNFDLALKAADTILAQISFLLKDRDPKNANKILASGTDSEQYKALSKKITEAMKYSMIANSRVSNRHIAAHYAYNMAREINIELKNAIYEAELYFKKGGNPNLATSRGLSGA